jgi:hypothetical protein
VCHTLPHRVPAGGCYYDQAMKKKAGASRDRTNASSSPVKENSQPAAAKTLQKNGSRCKICRKKVEVRRQSPVSSLLPRRSRPPSFSIPQFPSHAYAARQHLQEEVQRHVLLGRLQLSVSSCCCCPDQCVKKILGFVSLSLQSNPVKSTLRAGR